MKRLVILFVSALCLCGCAEKVNVLSFDGAYEGACYGGNVVECVANACPAGFVISIDRDKNDDTLVIRCNKP